MHYFYKNKFQKNKAEIGKKQEQIKNIFSLGSLKK